MPVSDPVLARAQQGDALAMEAILAVSYPRVCRIARAVAGDEGGSRVTRAVLRRGLRVLPTWRSGAAAENWFYHHTLLTAREWSERHPIPPDPRHDPLVGQAEPLDNLGYVAFIRALRQLPPQQAEAIILHHGERLNSRYLGVAMDCSSVAAENHLHAGTKALAATVGDGAADYAAILTRAYAALGPAEASVGETVREFLARERAPRRGRRWARWIVAAAVALAIAALLLWWGKGLPAFHGRTAIPNGRLA